MEGSLGTIPLPAGVRVVAAVFAACGIYLGIVGLLMLLSPYLVGMSLGAPLLFGLELAGPYMFLVTAVVAGGIAFGLAQRINLARRAAVLVAIAGIVMLVPPVSAAATMIQPGPLVRGGVSIIVRVIVAWYLCRREITEEFTAKQKAS